MHQRDNFPDNPVALLTRQVAAGLIGHERMVERLIIALLAGDMFCFRVPRALPGRGRSTVWPHICREKMPASSAPQICCPRI